MSTRCMIGILREDNSVDAIYCHHDGYPEHVGVVLMESYNKKERVEELISHGDTSMLYATIEECNFYHNDKDSTSEELHISHFQNESKFWTICTEDVFIEYAYLYTGGSWEIDRRTLASYLDEYKVKYNTPMTFDDLIFKPWAMRHQVFSASFMKECSKAKQAVLELPNGYSISVLLGCAFYSNGTDTYEIAIIKDGTLQEIDGITQGDTVIGYQIKEQINEIIKKYKHYDKEIQTKNPRWMQSRIRQPYNIKRARCNIGSFGTNVYAQNWFIRCI